MPRGIPTCKTIECIVDSYIHTDGLVKEGQAEMQQLKEGLISAAKLRKINVLDGTIGSVLVSDVKKGGDETYRLGDVAQAFQDARTEGEPESNYLVALLNALRDMEIPVGKLNPLLAAFNLTVKVNVSEVTVSKRLTIRKA